jgi:hypothetical protein
MDSIVQPPQELMRSIAETDVERVEIPELVPPEAEPGESRNYGPPATIARESNYISDESLLLWLAEKTGDKYGELHDAMDVSRRRSKLIEDLSHIKTMADRGATQEEVAAELTKLLEAYRGTEFEQELYEFAAPLIAGAMPERLQEAIESFADVSNEHLSQALQSKIDALGRDDQLALIQIQSLTADIREAQQLASNLMSSSSQAANAIIGNIGG